MSPISCCLPKSCRVHVAGGEVGVGVRVPDVDTTVLVVVLRGTGNGLGQGEPGGGRLVARQLGEEVVVEEIKDIRLVLPSPTARE